LIERVRAAVKIPVLAAGGIVDQEGVRQALDAGAVAAVMGTRFLLSEESRAHPDDKLRCLQADRTVLTELFGLGWAEAPHRVVPNAATRRCLAVALRLPVRPARRPPERQILAWEIAYLLAGHWSTVAADVYRARLAAWQSSTSTIYAAAASADSCRSAD
jgi:nitronate monooxygenase